MSGCVPAGDEAVDVAVEYEGRAEVGDPQRFALKNGEPLLDLVHPRTVDWREVEVEARVSGEPVLGCPAFVHAEVVEHEVDGRRRWRDEGVEQVEEGEELLGALALSAPGWMTSPVRVLKAAKRFKAPSRRYSCSTRTGLRGAAGAVAAVRPRGWMLVFSSRQNTTSDASKGRV